jgi:hypothetical protein
MRTNSVRAGRGVEYELISDDVCLDELAASVPDTVRCVRAHALTDRRATCTLCPRLRDCSRRIGGTMRAGACRSLSCEKVTPLARAQSDCRPDTIHRARARVSRVVGGVGIPDAVCEACALRGVKLLRTVMS